MVNKKPNVAGRFYPGTKAELDSKLSSFFTSNKDKIYDDVRAVISPHAGYNYSGNTAAKAFDEINPEKKFNNVFILAPSHYCNYNGAAIYTSGNFETPLGEVLVNINLGNLLIEESTAFVNYNAAYENEHSLEVQLPFLQYYFEHSFSIIPIIIGTHNSIVLNEIVKVIKPYFTNDNLFVISSDFSHFPTYQDAVEVDSATIEAIIKNDNELLLSTLKKNAKVSSVATSACGISGIQVLMSIVESAPNCEFKTIAYANSGDSLIGDKDRVVGYAAITVIENK